jgi:hypothetical protein
MIEATFDPKRLTPPSNAVHVFSGEGRSLEIKPGKVNRYSPEEFAWLEVQDGFPTLTECGAFVVVSATVETTEGETPAGKSTIDLKTDEAISLVNATDDVELLMAWDEADKRVTVSAAIVKRIEALAI